MALSMKQVDRLNKAMVSNQDPQLVGDLLAYLEAKNVTLAPVRVWIDKTAYEDGDTVEFAAGTSFSKIRIELNKMVTVVDGATPEVTIGGFQFATFITEDYFLDLTMTGPNGNAFVAGEFTFDVAADTVKDFAGTNNDALSLTLTFTEV